MKKRWLWWAVGGVASAVALALSLGALGGATVQQADAADPGVETGIRMTLQSLIDANNRADFGALSAGFTDDGFQQFFGESKADAASDPELFGDQVALRSVHDIVATSTGATAVAEFEAGLALQANAITFLLQNNRWIIVAAEVGEPNLASDTKVVDMKLQEYAFVFNTAAVSSGNVAFNVTNTGKQEHEMVLLKTDPSMTVADLLTAFQSEDKSGPPPFSEFGFLGMLEPGQSATAALSHPLEDGKYFFVCFIPDAADGVPHALKGMIQDFTVGAPVTAPVTTTPSGTITPPSTGDAGLVDGADNLGIAALALTLVVSTLGLGAVKLARR